MLTSRRACRWPPDHRIARGPGHDLESQHFTLLECQLLVGFVDAGGEQRLLDRGHANVGTEPLNRNDHTREARQDTVEGLLRILDRVVERQQILGHFCKGLRHIEGHLGLETGTQEDRLKRGQLVFEFENRLVYVPREDGGEFLGIAREVFKNRFEAADLLLGIGERLHRAASKLVSVPKNAVPINPLMVSDSPAFRNSLESRPKNEPEKKLRTTSVKPFPARANADTKTSPLKADRNAPRIDRAIADWAPDPNDEPGESVERARCIVRNWASNSFMPLMAADLSSTISMKDLPARI